MKVHNSKLERKAIAVEDQAQELGEMLEAKQGNVLRHKEEEIAAYKSSMGFRKGLERSGVALYKFGYLITLAYFKIRYPNLELEMDPFIDFLILDLSQN